MKTFIIIRKEDLKIMGSYDAETKDDSSANRSHLLAEPKCVHIEMLEDLDIDCISASYDSDSNTYNVSEDADKIAEKVQTQRDAKLYTLRSMRDVKLNSADIEIMKHQDSDPAAIATESDWRQYRIALRNVTFDYKDGQDTGSSELDQFELDMSDFNWPVKPS